MEKTAKRIANYLVEKKAITRDEYEICKYGLLTGMEMFTCITACFIISIYMGMLRECTILFLVFFLVRSFVGGLHMDSFKACFVCSCVVVSITLLTIKYCTISKTVSMIFTIGEIFFLSFLNPVENRNRPVNEKEKKIFLLRIRQILLALFLLAILFYIADLNVYLNTFTYALGVIILSMFFGRLKNKIQIIKD